MLIPTKFPLSHSKHYTEINPELHITNKAIDLETLNLWLYSFIPINTRLNIAICFIFLLTLSDRSRPPSNQIPFAVRSDSVRHPIGFRSPSAPIASAER